MNNLTSYSFFKLIKKLEKDYGRKNIFLRTNKSLKHPNKDIEKIIFSEHEQSVIELFINFMGLHGVSSQLPSFMLDKLSRNEDGDQGWTLFFDFFNHYLLWIFFDVISLKIIHDLLMKILKILFQKFYLACWELKNTILQKIFTICTFTTKFKTT